MKPLFLAALLLLLEVPGVFPADFAPARLRIYSPSWIYNYPGDVLTFPVTVSGTDALVTFALYTRNKAQTLHAVQNGYLGWHYINRIDTCVYLSAPMQFDRGEHTITWYDRGENIHPLLPNEYTFYLWGYDPNSPKVRASRVISTDVSDNPPRIIEMDAQDKPLANPVWWSKNQRWALGGDPDDAALLETCSIIPPEGFTLGKNIGKLPRDTSDIIVGIGQTATSRHGVALYRWVPNGIAELKTAWGDNGLGLIEGPHAGGRAEAGVESIQDYLFTVTGIHDDPEAGIKLDYWDNQYGILLRRLDLSLWWNNPKDVQAGGQMNGGPGFIASRKGMLYLNGEFSCLAQAIDPFREEDSDMVVWTNGNGDRVFDRNYSPDAKHPWVCNDSTTGPFSYTLTADNTQFALAPCEGQGSASFGLLAPDGTGVGYFSFAGETSGPKKFDFICDNGSAFDGIYCDNESGSGDTAGIWYIAQDSVKGVYMHDWVDAVNEESPADFTVSRNTPNPFNPTTTISFTLARAGKTTVDIYTVAGQKVDTLVNGNLSAGAHSVVWNAAAFSAGVYFYTVKSGEFSKTMKMTLLK